MSNFYTNVQSFGNNILFRGIQNGKRTKEKVEYSPSLFLPSKKITNYTSLDGDYLDHKKFKDIKSARDYIKQFDGVSGAPKIYGQTRFEYAFIAEQHKGMVDYDFEQVSIAVVDIEVGSENGFPDPYQANEPITAIGLKRLGGKMIVWGCGEYNRELDETNPGIDITYIQCKDEWTLCKKFIQQWQHNLPDVITGWNTKAVSRTQCDTMPSPTTMCLSLGMRLLLLSRNISINWIHRTKRSFIPLAVQATKRRFCISYLCAHSVPTTSQIVPTCATKPVQSG